MSPGGPILTSVDNADLQSRLSATPNQGLVCGVTSSSVGEGRSIWIKLLADAASKCGFRVVILSAAAMGLLWLGVDEGLVVRLRPARGAPAGGAPPADSQSAIRPASSALMDCGGMGMLPHTPEPPARKSRAVPSSSDPVSCTLSSGERSHTLLPISTPTASRGCSPPRARRSCV